MQLGTAVVIFAVLFCIGGNLLLPSSEAKVVNGLAHGHQSGVVRGSSGNSRGHGGSSGGGGGGFNSGGGRGYSG